VQVVIHNHARYGTIWANARRVPPVYDQTSAQVDGEVVLIDEYTTTVNDQAEGASCARALGDAKWALLANHGVLIVARDVRQAHLRALTLEWRCRQAWLVEAIGGGEPMAESVANRVGAMIDGAGFPFLWEAMVRRGLRRHPEASD
jgi:ribulose-5-phosphate 4-epimerase/fuculose-1-phosphate aldolase